MRSLRKFISTALLSAAIAGCSGEERVEYSGWNRDLHAAIDGADRLVIQDALPQEGEKPLRLELEDPQAVKHFISNLSINEGWSGYRWACMGGLNLDFFSGERLLARIGWIGCSIIRWPDGPWPGDAAATEETMGMFADWLKERGYPAWRAKIDASHESWNEMLPYLSMLLMGLAGLGVVVSFLLRTKPAKGSPRRRKHRTGSFATQAQPDPNLSVGRTG